MSVVHVSVELWSVAMLVHANLAQVDGWGATFHKHGFNVHCDEQTVLRLSGTHLHFLKKF